MLRKRLFFLCLLSVKFGLIFAQREGFFIAPHVLTGYNYISPVYHLNTDYAPANRGYNVAFQFGGVTGYKLDKMGIQAEVNSSYFQQNFKQNDLEGNLQLNYLSFGGSLFYQFERIKSSRYYHTVKLGYCANVPQHAYYIVKNSLDATIHADQDVLYQFTTDHMITAAYGITTGYKLLWADFSIVAGYSLTNIYKPLTGVKANNFFLGFSLGFGLFLNTNK